MRSDLKVLVWDTETVHGHIFYQGLYDGSVFQTCYGLDKDHQRWLTEKLPPNCVVFAFNLGYDLGCLLFSSAKEFFQVEKSRRAPIDLKWFDKKHDVVWQIKMDKPVLGSVTYPSQVKCLFRDAMAFFPERTSLNKAAEMVGLTLQKEQKPASLGTRLYSEAFLRPYLFRDCELLQGIVTKIMAWHEEYNLPLCVSSPHMASVIFRKRFMDAPMKASYRFMHARILKTYHGGKLYAKPDTYRKATLVDVKSAYPFAMLDLPKFCCGTWAFVDHWAGRYGVYKVWGAYTACAWGLFCPPGANQPLGSGYLAGFWVAGHELQEAMDWDHFRPEKIAGYVWKEPEKECEHRNPFQSFVRELFAKRAQSKNKHESLFCKLMLNSLYGKFGERQRDEDGNKTRVGIMFEPFIYTLITAHTRAYMHYWEHELDSKHTATDSIITEKEIPVWALGKQMGYLGIEAQGKAVILRNKCYAIYKGRTIIKAAQHGYQGDLQTLIEKARKGVSIRYLKKGLLTWRTAWRQELQPGQVRRQKMMVHLPIKGVSHAKGKKSGIDRPTRDHAGQTDYIGTGAIRGDGSDREL